MMREVEKKGMRLGKYELERTLGEGNFGKVKLAKNLESGESFAVKILDKKRILDLKITYQLEREIGTLKLLKHPNVVRLHEILASKNKIYMVLEYVEGGELFNRIKLIGRFSEAKGRKLFQQLIDAVSYCHDKCVYHRDLKLENILIDVNGNIKVSDFGLSASPQNFRDDGLLHTTCGSPSYVAPEVLSYRGYDGATSDLWSCGVILYVVLVGCLPFDDRNVVVLYHKILKGDLQIPKWLSPGARNMIRRILDPNLSTRITMSEIKEDDWFKQDYIPAKPEDEEDIFIDDEAFSIHHKPTDSEKLTSSSTLINAFELIGMSSFLDLSGFFEKEDVSERKIRFTSNHSLKELLEKIEDIVTDMGFKVQKGNGKVGNVDTDLILEKWDISRDPLVSFPARKRQMRKAALPMMKVMQQHRGQKGQGSLSVTAEMFVISPSLYVVELRKSNGDSSLYRQLCTKLSSDLGVCQSQQLLISSV